MDFEKDYSKRNLSEVVVSYVKDQILSGELKSGDKVIESTISSVLEISRPPVREGLRSLNEQGMVTFSPRKGNHIIELNRAEFLEVFQIRTFLENQILFILIKNNLLAEEDFERLHKMTEQMHENVDRDLPMEEMTYNINRLDLDFHHYLWEKSQCHQRAKLLEGLFFQLLIGMNKDLDSFGYVKDKSEQHVKILDALSSGDIQRVFAEFQLHLFSYLTSSVEDLSSGEIELFKVLSAPFGSMTELSF